MIRLREKAIVSHANGESIVFPRRNGRRRKRTLDGTLNHRGCAVGRTVCRGKDQIPALLQPVQSTRNVQKVPVG